MKAKMEMISMKAKMEMKMTTNKEKKMPIRRKERIMEGEQFRQWLYNNSFNAREAAKKLNVNEAAIRNLASSRKVVTREIVDRMGLTMTEVAMLPALTILPRTGVWAGGRPSKTKIGGAK